PSWSKAPSTYSALELSPPPGLSIRAARPSVWARARQLALCEAPQKTVPAAAPKKQCSTALALPRQSGKSLRPRFQQQGRAQIAKPLHFPKAALLALQVPRRERHHTSQSALRSPRIDGSQMSAPAAHEILHPLALRFPS